MKNSIRKPAFRWGLSLILLITFAQLIGSFIYLFLDKLAKNVGLLSSTILAGLLLSIILAIKSSKIMQDLLQKLENQTIKILFLSLLKLYLIAFALITIFLAAFRQQIEFLSLREYIGAYILVWLMSLFLLINFDKKTKLEFKDATFRKLLLYFMLILMLISLYVLFN